MKSKKMIKTLSILLTLGLLTTFTGCIPDGDTDDKQKIKQEEMLKQANGQLGMPNIKNFQEKKLMKQIMELCDKSDLICYVYSFSEYTGKYNYIGKCIGFGLPYGTQYTNPLKETNGSSGAVINNADPSGLFKPSDVNATWICMVDEKTGERYILYSEPNISISSHKLPKELLNSVPNNY